MKVRHIDGKYLRVSELPPPAPRRRHQAEPYSWEATRAMPCRRLAVRAYSPYPRASWERQWLEAEPGKLFGLLPRICGELFAAAPEIVRLLGIAEEQRVAEQARIEEQHRRWEQERIAGLRVETAKKSTDHLLALIDAWARVVRIEQFFEDAARRAAATSAEEDRSLLLDRIALARDLIGKSDALEHLRTWRSPAELLRAAGVDADQ